MSTIEISVEVRAKTPKAWLCYDGKISEWVPISQIDDYGVDAKGTVYSIFISEWLAEQKGFI